MEMNTLILLPLAILFAIGATTPSKEGETVISIIKGRGYPSWRTFAMYLFLSPLVVYCGGEECVRVVKKWWAKRQARKAAKRILKKIGDYRGDDPEILDVIEKAKKALREL